MTLAIGMYRHHDECAACVKLTDPVTVVRSEPSKFRFSSSLRPVASAARLWSALESCLSDASPNLFVVCIVSSRCFG